MTRRIFRIRSGKTGLWWYATGRAWVVGQRASTAFPTYFDAAIAALNATVSESPADDTVRIVTLVRRGR